MPEFQPGSLVVWVLGGVGGGGTTTCVCVYLCGSVHTVFVRERMYVNVLMRKANFFTCVYVYV